ncbi:hypothetical protein V8F06_009123 [Rhypophila decipiens]
MCIRHNIHRMYCDVRPLVAVARQTADGQPTIRKYVNPYHPPHSCHKHEREYVTVHGLLRPDQPDSGYVPVHDLLKSSTNCPFNGCCRLQVIDLPCDCANEKKNRHWGKGKQEDITQCVHFRNYHQHKYRTNRIKEAKKANHHLLVDTTDKPWDEPDLPYLDSWVLLDFEDVNFFCERAVFSAARSDFLAKGECLLDEFNKAELWQTMVNNKTVAEARVAASELSDEKKQEIKQGVVKAWNEMRLQQAKLWKMDPVRTEGMLGFSPKDQICPEDQPVASGYFVAPFMPKRPVLNPVRLEMKML